MSLPAGAMEVAQEFARAVIQRNWADIVPLMSASALSCTTEEVLATSFGWESLGPLLRQEYIVATGESEDMVPELDPPQRFELFEVEDRDPPVHHDPQIPMGWVEVDFYPAEDSGFDECYNCFLAFIDEDGPRITAYQVVGTLE